MGPPLVGFSSRGHMCILLKPVRSKHATTHSHRIPMELKDARVHFLQDHVGLVQYQLTFESMKHGLEHMIRYLRTARALEIDLIQVTSNTGGVTTKKLHANYNKYEDNVVLVGFISDCEDAKQITFNLPALNSVWNIHRGERAIVYNGDNQSLVLMDWGRAKGAKANVTITELTNSKAEAMLSQGRWLPEGFIGFGVNITMSIMDRSLKEQIGVEALMSLTMMC